MAKYAYDDDMDRGTGDRIREAAAEHPGATALVSLLTSPIALKLGSVAFRWARRHPLVAIGVAAGAYAIWTRRQRGRTYDGDAESGGVRGASSAGDSEDVPGAAHGSTSGVGDVTRRRAGDSDTTSVASSL